MKVCSKCKKQKDLHEFGKDKYAKDGLKYSCKYCCNKIARNKEKKKCEFTCLSCGETKLVDYYTDKKRKHNYCLNCYSKNIQSGVRKCKNKERSYISSDGYKMIKIIGEYDTKGKPLYKRQHVLVMEQHIGRKLKTQRGLMGEQVHHIDGDKLNNNIDNLLFCKDTREHKKIDCQLHQLAFELVQKNVISFNHNEKKYSINWEKINESGIT
jgi:hypothetical protein